MSFRRERKDEDLQEPQLTITPLPPLPKLRPRPGLIRSLKPEPAKDKKPSDEDSPKTSRLLMKSECRSSGGRRKNAASLVHSIPKFSEVKKGRLSEVQKVLQSRLLSKQRLKQQQLQQQQGLINQSGSNDIRNALPPSIPQHEKNQVPPVKARRGRKPDKHEITHVLKNAPILPHLSEVTITPRLVYTPSFRAGEDQALDLRTNSRSPQKDLSTSASSRQELKTNGSRRKRTASPGKVSLLSDSNNEIAEKMSQKRRVNAQLTSGDKKRKVCSQKMSICKFKFTAGEKPSLQEKRMLSVDSIGKFRYVESSDKTPKLSFSAMERSASDTLVPTGSSFAPSGSGTYCKFKRISSTHNIRQIEDDNEGEEEGDL